MESSAVLHTCLAVSVTPGLAGTQDSLMWDCQRVLHTNGGRLPPVPSPEALCSAKGRGMGGTVPPLPVIFLFSSPSFLLSPGPSPALKLLLPQPPKKSEGCLSILMDTTATSNSRYPALPQAFIYRHCSKQSLSLGRRFSTHVLLELCSEGLLWNQHWAPRQGAPAWGKDPTLGIDKKQDIREDHSRENSAPSNSISLQSQ